MSLIPDYERYDAVALADLVASKAVSPLELLETAIERVETLNPALNAVVHKHYDLARAAIGNGLPDGPFRGVPFLLKDLDLALAGTVLSNGSRLFANFVPDYDSTLVARYKAAGLVIFGKTNSAELGNSSACEPLAFGPTRNPWNTAYSTAGSSGGTAAAVAAGLVPMAHGTDGGGSIRMPASLCGLFGLKPSRGRTPSGPKASEIYFGMSASHALTRSVRDSARLLDATAGAEAGGRSSLPAPAVSFEAHAGRDPTPLRIALMKTPFSGRAVDPACAATVERAARFCEQLGHHVEEARPAVDSSRLGTLFRRLGAAFTLALVEDFAAAHGIADPRALMEPITAAAMDEALSLSAVDHVRAIDGAHAVGRILAAFFEDYDLLLSPVTAQARLSIGHLDPDSTDLARFGERLGAFGGFTGHFNAAGMPAMSVPFDVVDGMPVGVQFGAALGREDRLFALAGQIERARPWIGALPLGEALQAA
ncbi:amidase [Kaistia dalseonensis]|uniref:Asp-tRNA(Asn)/Glu-tRNA(Gln) amidotransferase A subunit family amidase n=1 Tax=Kaistia dalseonensis TaxID=410840 RepID=A0ABU0H586_9HYPH|nr:amidase [Kaistia dalseonensis]MCX5494085.1 amidase [Kaistia dalseonensis]MDQ0436664.1 Asp-tRNA(Asn)/Glu-tRNA(Gln) amidotransferase A subunit family amidase [Kaistia dalseonensis]